jgi:hypothetical protein
MGQGGAKVPNASHLQKPPTGKIFLRTVIAAAAATIVNNLYSIVYTVLTGFSLPEVINPVSITMLSAVPVLLGGVIYWIASRFNVKVANVGLAVGTVILFFVFSIPSFSETITTPTMTMEAPEGFAGLSFGLHFAGPILLLALVPEWRRRSD